MFARIWTAIVLGIALAGCGNSNPLLKSPEGVAIDRYLRDELPDGEYEVVRWWPMMQSPELDKRILDRLREDERLAQNLLDARKEVVRAGAATFSESVGIAEDAGKKKGLRELAESYAPFKTSRLKFRFVTEGGGKATRDHAFWIDPAGRAVIVPKDIEYEIKSGFSE